MAKQTSIPEWAKKGAVSVKSYDLRVLWYGIEVKQWGDHWPFLSRDPELPGSADEGAWDAYFRDHLGGFSPSYRLYRDGVVGHLNVPEVRPELFDPTYKSRPALGPDENVIDFR